MLPLLQGIEKKSMEAKPPQLLYTKLVRKRQMSYKKHRKIVFKAGDWVWIPDVYNSDSTFNIADLSLCFSGSNLRTNPFEEEEDDTIIASVQVTRDSPKDPMKRERTKQFKDHRFNLVKKAFLKELGHIQGPSPLCKPVIRVGENQEISKTDN